MLSNIVRVKRYAWRTSYIRVCNVLRSTAIPLGISFVHLEKNQIVEHPTIYVRTSLSNTLEEFRIQLYNHFNHDPHTFKLFVMFETKGNAAKFVNDEKLQLRDCGGDLPNSKVRVDGSVKRCLAGITRFGKKKNFRFSRRYSLVLVQPITSWSVEHWCEL